MIVIENFGILSYKIASPLLYGFNPADNDILQIMNLTIFAWIIINNPIDIALLIKLIA